MSGATVFSGLGTRPGAPPPPDDVDEKDDGQPVRRIVDAATAPPISSIGAVSPFELPHLARFRAAVARPADCHESNHNEEGDMPKDKKAGAPRNVQRRVIEVLKASGKPITQPEIAKLLPDLDGKQLGNALFNASANSRAKRDNSQRWTITPRGREWLQDREEDAQERAPAPAKAKTKAPAKRAAKKAARKAVVVKRALVRRQEVESTPPSKLSANQVPASRTFRCAVISDGGFMLAKGGVQIELEPAEHKEMLAYLERMAEAD
jgi:hypothetical protein